MRQKLSIWAKIQDGGRQLSHLSEPCSGKPVIRSLEKPFTSSLWRSLYAISHHYYNISNQTDD